METYKYAAIDIGSNAVRLLFAHMGEVGGQPQVNKDFLLRNAVRLGDDAFLYDRISREKADQLVYLMKAYKYLMLAEQPVAYRACATSAMREAVNGAEIVERIARETGINVEIIDGAEEARMVYTNQPKLFATDEDMAYLLMDIGGGSVELTHIYEGEVLDSRSFNLGTIRQLHRLTTPEELESMRKWVLHCRQQTPTIQLVGSGGNINKIQKMTDSKRNSHTVSYRQITKLQEHLLQFTYEERVQQLGLNPDRADVIMPAIATFLDVMEWSGSKHVLIPSIGVSDGIIYELHAKHTGKHA